MSSFLEKTKKSELKKKGEMKKEKRRHLKVKMWWNIVLYTGISNFKTFGSLESHTKIIP